MDNKMLGMIGTGLGLAGTISQMNEIMQIVSAVVTAIGAVITWIIIPLLTWWKNAKKDGKITTEEVEEGVKTLQDGIEKVTKKGDDEDAKD